MGCIRDTKRHDGVDYCDPTIAILTPSRFRSNRNGHFSASLVNENLKQTATKNRLSTCEDETVARAESPYPKGSVNRDEFTKSSTQIYV
jgi:hypothetical protein